MTMTTTPDTRTAPTRGRSVLTVEDNAFTRADLRFILETAGFEVCPDARDGIEAVEMARAWNPDAILLDLGLPHIDGVEAAKLILEDRDIPIVAVTGRTRAEEAQAIEAGAVACIRKPFSAYDVVKAVTSAVTHGSFRDERRESLEVISELLELTGNSRETAVDLERRAFEAGSFWRRTR